MATQITATPPRTTTAPPLGVIGLAILAVIAVAVIGAGALIQAGSMNGLSADSHRYGAGYPLNGGLAGPSRLGLVSTVDVAGSSRAGYPLHGGLAGPSRLGLVSTVDVAGSSRAGYPLHGGLAGPSRVESGD